MANPSPTLRGLAATVAQSAQAVLSYLDSHGLPDPSFAEDSPAEYPKDPELLGPRFQLIESLSDMLQLAMGPADVAFLQPPLWNSDPSVLYILLEFGFFSAVPLGGHATYKELAEATKLPESIVYRILRHAATMRLFSEEPQGSGKIVHTATTAHIAKTTHLRGWMSHHLGESRGAYYHLADSLRQFSAGKENPSNEPIESGFALAHPDKNGDPSTFWQWLKDDAEGSRIKRFSQNLQTATLASSVSPSQVVKLGLDWASLGETTIVDVGGSSGHDAIALARDFSKLKFVVQDLPEVEAAFQSSLPEDLATRIQFQCHDFFTPQTNPADIFFLKMILHDWGDEYAIKIIRNLLPGLRPGGRIVICDAVAPPTNSAPLIARRLLSSVDLQMLSYFNSLERDLEAWTQLLQHADKRLKIRNVTGFPGALWSLVEVIFEEETT